MKTLTAEYTNNKEYEQAPKGTHLAICTRIMDIGTHEQEYKGDKYTARQVIFTWELPNKNMQDGQPFTINKWYSLSFGAKATLANHIESWVGTRPERGFNILTLLGKACMLNIIHTESGKASVKTISEIEEGRDVPKPHNEPSLFSLSAFDRVDFDNLPKWVKDKVMMSPEYLELANAPVTQDASDDDLNDEIPF